jgi:hypothetical protein
MDASEGELSPLLLHPVIPGDHGHAQSPFQHQALPGANTILEILGKVAPAHNLEPARRVVGAQPIHLHQHLGYGGLVVLGVANLGCFQDVHFKQTVIHASAFAIWEPS